MKWFELPTPAFLIDLDRLEANAGWMLDRCRRLGVTLRPHVKTHKCLEAARLQCGGKNGPITVSTLAEAEFFAAGGFADIAWAFPATPDKLERAATVQESAPGLRLVLDNPATLEAVEDFGRRRGTRFRVLLKVDCGYHRAGVDPDAEGAVELAERLEGSPQIQFDGLLTHGGQSYGATGAEGIREAAAEERDRIVDFAERLRRHGVAVEVVSLGSTPTLSHVDHLEGVTEARPGNYLFLDRFQAAIGTAPLQNCAVSVAAQVVGIYPERELLLVDAGALAMSKDGGATQLAGFSGYGAIANADGLELSSVSQEHGLVTGPPGTDWARFEIGQRFRILPNHSCLTAALFPSYAVCRGDDVVDEWRPVRGW